ncbi:hypothetical protein ACHWQZ_G006440 [Mnemiopsis leidyi]
MQFLMSVSRNPVNQIYKREVEEEVENVEEAVDWHAILVADFEYTDPSEEEISSGEELESEEDGEEFSSSRLPLVPMKEHEMSAAIIPKYSDICQSLIKQYWRYDSHLEPITELQIIREILTMLQGAPTSYLFPVFDENKVYLREDIVVQHYSAEALDSVLNYFLKIIQMVQSLHFVSDDVLNFVAQPSHPYGSRTYQAFACAIFMYLQQLTSAMSVIERKVMRQSEIVTFIRLKEAIREHCDIVNALYDMVEEILHQIDLDSPSVCVTRLINILFNTLELYESMGILSQHVTKVLLTVFLCTLQPLLTTIDTWLSHGDLNNTTDELFLSRDPDVSISSTEFWDRGLVFKDTDGGPDNQIPGIFLQIGEKLLKAGKAIELIRKLGKLGDPDADMFHVFIKEYLGKSLSCQVPEKAVVPFDLGIIVNDQSENDKLLTSLFVDLAESLSPQQDKLPIYNEIFNNIGKLHILPSTAILKILVPLMEKRCTQVSFSLLKILRQDFYLDVHLNTLRKVLLMEAGLPMSTFCDEMFKDVYMGETLRGMTPFLRECMSPHTNYSSHLRMSVQNKLGPVKQSTSDLDTFQCVKIDYLPPFPVDIVLDQELLVIYQKVFTLLLQIKYTAWCVLPLVVQSNLKFPLSTEVHCFKYELINFIKIIQTYTMQRVLHCTGADMRSELDKALELDQYVQIHKKYCHIMEEYCLLTPEYSSCLGAIRHALSKGIKFRRLLDNDELDTAALAQIMRDVRKCIEFVTNLVKKRNQVASVPQPHFDWLETSLSTDH